MTEIALTMMNTCKEGRADAPPKRHVAFLGADEEIVIHSGTKVAAGTEDKRRLVLGSLKAARER